MIKMKMPHRCSTRRLVLFLSFLFLIFFSGEGGNILDVPSSLLQALETLLSTHPACPSGGKDLAIWPGQVL